MDDGIWLADEHVVEFVANQRLGQVGQIGDQYLGRRDARRHRTVVGVDQLDDAHVGVEHEDVVVFRGLADQALGTGEAVQDGDPERVG